MSSTRSVEGHIERVAVSGLERPRALAIGSFRVDLAIASVVLLMLLLSAVRLDRYPAPWFDEGIHLQVAKNFVADGTYAARSADGTLDYAPAIGVGPTLLLPVATMLDIFGTSLLAGRMVPAFYLIITTVLLFTITRSLFGKLAGFMTLAVLLAMPALDWVETGRQVLGEVPALAFLLLGGVLVRRATSPPTLLLGSFVLGLSLVTKGQYVLIVPVTLLALAAVDLRWTHHRSLVWYATVMVTVLGTWAAWIGTLLLIVGDGSIAENVTMLRETSSGALLVFDTGRMAAAWKVVLGPGVLFMVIPAALAGLLAIRVSEGERRFALLALWLVQATWLGWFLFASIGWPRYAFAGLAINAIFAGHLIDKLQLAARNAGVRRPMRTQVLATATCCVLALLLVTGGWRTLAPVAQANNQDAEQFARVLDSRVPAGEAVAAWEPELGFLSDVAIQAPPPGSLSHVVDLRWFGGTMPDFSAGITGNFLVIGPFARWVGVYRDATSSAGWQRVAVVGEYELYQRRLD